MENGLGMLPFGLLDRRLANHLATYPTLDTQIRIIGSVIVYMILANDVANRLPEYATLKAMGYSQFALARIVIMQSWFLAILSYLPAMIVAVALYQLTASLSKIPTVMTWERTFGVLGLALLMCTVSAAMAMLKLWKAEPASLF